MERFWGAGGGKISCEFFAMRDRDDFFRALEEGRALRRAAEEGDAAALMEIMLPFDRELPIKFSDDSGRDSEARFASRLYAIACFCVNLGMDTEEARARAEMFARKGNDEPAARESGTLLENAAVAFARALVKSENCRFVSDQVADAVEFIYGHLGEKISLDALASRVGMNKTYLCERFKREMGETVGRYAMALKISTAEKMLAFTDISIAEASECLSFSSVSHFVRAFKKYTGQTPGRARPRTEE